MEKWRAMDAAKYPDGIQFFGKWKKNERNG